LQYYSFNYKNNTFIYVTASGEIVKKKLGEVSKASVLSNLTAVVNGLGLIKQDLSNVDSLTRQLQETALQLDAGTILYYLIIII